MYIKNNNKYKDELPINTVNKIKDILYNHNLEPVESTWKNSAEGFYSLRVSIKGTSLATNGKGTTIEYALASAYGELMERLQNQCAYRLSIDLGNDALKYRNFYYAPDEKYVSINDFIRQNDEWTQIQVNNMKPNTNLFELFNKWKLISYEEIDCDFVTVPFLNLITKNISYIPIKMISKMYMSNGMCAGNTIEEALVQGLSEVFERYVNRKIICENICPPTIPRKSLNKFPRILEMIDHIEEKGNYKVVIKDCSLNKGYPVVSAIFINRDNQTYFIKFGSHPIIEIALERTLTELLQGQDVKDMMGVKEYSYLPPINSKEQNLMGILVNGSGYYPSEYFSSKHSYNFKGINNLSGYSNKELLLYLLNLLYRDKYNVYVRDYSYLGFPSYHVVVPGLSEIESMDDLTSIEQYSRFVKVKKYIRNIIHLTNNDIKDMLSLMKELNIQGPTSVTQLINLDINGQLPWYYNNVDLFKAAAYLKINDYEKAYQLIDSYITSINVNPYNREIYTYYKCVRDYIGIKTKFKKDEDCIKEFSKFYPKYIIDDVIKNYKVSDSIFKNYGHINCWNCSRCSYSKTCNYKNIANVYKILKEANAKNFIDQRRMLSQLSL